MTLRLLLSAAVLATLGTSSAISLSGQSSVSVLRPSISSFRPMGSSAMNLKGGQDSFPIDAPTALKISSAAYGVYGLMCIPDLNLPIFDLALKKHDSLNSLFYNDPSPPTDSNVKAFRWIASSFFALSGFNYLAATEGSADLQKFINKNTLACGGPIVVPACAIMHGLASL